jgi:hypothetical protein
MSVCRDVRVHLVLGLALPVLAMSFHGSRAIQQNAYNAGGWLVVVGYSLGHCMSFLLDAQLAALVAVLRLPLAALNERLKQHSSVSSAAHFAWSDGREAHLRVVELGDLLSRAYGPPLLISVLTSCLQVGGAGLSFNYVFKFRKRAQYNG